MTVIYEFKIEPILENFINEEENAIKKIFEEANEPYIFIAAAIEYKNYKQAEAKGEKYMTGFSIIMNCSGSGPQLISLILADEKFAPYLNLEANLQRQDFYISLIKDFLLKTKELSDQLINYEDKDCLNLLRKYCKINTMTQFYGLSYLKFSKTLMAWFTGSEFKKYIKEDRDYNNFIETFIKEYWSYMQKLPLFKLKGFFQYIGKQLKKKEIYVGKC